MRWLAGVVFSALAASCSCGKPAAAHADLVAAIAPPSCGGGRRLTVHFYDVGQGLSALVDLPDGRHVLVDTGDAPARPGCGSVCAEKDRHLRDALASDLGGAPIDLLWITHQHSDHIGGAPEILGAFRVATYADNGRDERKDEVRRARREAAARGTVVRIVDPDHAGSPIAASRDVTLTPIVPIAWPASCARDPNECSIGLRIDFCSSSVLFLGDAEHAEESALDPRGRVTLLQVAHHGSETSTSPAFLMKAHPTYAVISSGRPDEGMNHEFCHPRALVVERLTHFLGGAGGTTLRAFDGERCDRAILSDWVAVPTSDRLWATARDGDVVLTTTGDGAFTRL